MKELQIGEFRNQNLNNLKTISNLINELNEKSSDYFFGSGNKNIDFDSFTIDITENGLDLTSLTHNNGFNRIFKFEKIFHFPLLLLLLIVFN